VATATPIQPQQRKQRAHAKPETTHTPLALWHLLSLDAPTVAALWTWFVASANHIHLAASSILAIAVAVWMLYAADRLLDARSMDARLMDARLPDTAFPQKEGLEARHYFHHQHRNAFLTGILLASIALAVLLPHLEPAALHLYLILGGLLAGYFILIHATPRAASNKAAHRLPKEIAVGVFFASAIFIPTVARRPDLRFTLLPAALLFAAVCSLNCLFIYAWEHSSPNPTAHTTTRFSLRHLPLLATLIPAFATALICLQKSHQAPWPIPTACALSAILLLLLHHHRSAIAPVTLRAAADLALITPLLLLPFLHL
jgi:membrane protein YdbS with pleckstrin-like domain